MTRLIGRELKHFATAIPGARYGKLQKSPAIALAAKIRTDANAFDLSALRPFEGQMWNIKNLQRRNDFAVDRAHNNFIVFGSLNFVERFEITGGDRNRS